MTRRLTIPFFGAAVSASILCGFVLAQTTSQMPPGLEFQGETATSTVWLKTNSVAEITEGVRIGTFLQNTTMDVQFTDGREVTLRSIQIQIQVNCTDGDYLELAEAHFPEEFGKGTQIWASAANPATSGLAPKQYLPVGSMMHLVVNSICTQKLTQSTA